MKKSKAKDILSKIITFLMVIIGAIALVSVLEYFLPQDAPFWYPLMEVALFLSFSFLQIIIHEAGHLVFGLVSGYKFCSFRVMNIMIARINGKFVLKKYSVAGTGGQCLMIPPEQKNGEFPVKLYNFGGALMNLITSVIALLIYFISENRFIHMCLAFFILNGLYFAFTNGIPHKTALIANDGYNALSLSKDKKAANALWVQLMVNARFTDGARLKDMPEEWFEMPNDEDMKNNMISAIGVLHCGRLLDNHQFEEDEREITRILSMESGLAGVHRLLLNCDLIYLRLILDKDFESIVSLFTKEQEAFMNSAKDSLSVICAKYAYAALGERNTENAQKYEKQFIKIAKSYPFSGDLESQKELLDIVKSKAQM